MDNPITHEITVLVKDLLMPLAEKKRANTSEFENFLKEEMFDDLQYIQSLEKELDELQSDKTEFSNEYDLLLQECLSKDILCVALSSMTDIDEYFEMACKYLEKVKECECLEIELSKQKDTVSKQDYHKLYFEIQDLKAQLQDRDIGISELKKLIEKSKGKSVETNFDKPPVVRQTNAIKVLKPSILGKPTPFLVSLKKRNFSKERSVTKTDVHKGLSKPVTPQNLPQTQTGKEAEINKNVIKSWMYRLDTRPTQTRTTQLPQTFRNSNNQVSTSTGLIHNTSVSKPQLRSNQIKDKSVTACNDSLKSRTSNVNVVCATCRKCVFNSIHDACVSKFLNDVNARSKKPQVVPIIPRKPIRKANRSVATPPKKTVASNSTIQKSKSYYRILYEKTTYDGNLKLVCNFVGKYLGTVRFENDQFAPILGYGDLVQGNIKIKRVYYVKGLNHNLFSVGQFYDADMEVAFRKSTCYIRDLQGNGLLTGTRGSNLYIITLQESSSPTPICFLAKASPTQAWLWHRRFSHLNFDTINLLSKNDIVKGLPKLKFIKDQLCSSCEMGKAKRSSFKSLTITRSKKWLDLLHMDLCGPMQIETINGKKYILVIVDDYSRYTWTLFMRSKGETSKVLKDFLKMIQRKLLAQVIMVQTDRGTEFLNKTFHAYFKEEGIVHQTSTP
ncbi:retrovirus-related pol polyprotein from transposon TNT 1-94 [Tanacetum coccineum]